MKARAGRTAGHPALHRKGTHLLVLLAYASVAVATTWPLVARLTTHLPGGTTDTLVHYWNGWWVGRALSTGQTLSEIRAAGAGGFAARGRKTLIALSGR